ncbi:MAG: NAD(P)/FAD-dependent oxidoreductase [Prochloraceae cyanobacterium]|nr:NAD(P)/FAD-dependent oxidoreductase [Prochloraceae cyanobacterium]
MVNSEKTSDRTEGERRALIVGCGPTGGLMALYLAQMGWKISVCEKRDCYANWIDKEERERSFNIVLNPRGIKALHQAGVDLPAEKAVALQGNVRHTKQGIKVSNTFSQNLSINRNVLAMHLWQEGTRRFPKQIKYNFNHKLNAVDFDKRIATFETENGTTEKSYDLLVGADGVYSKVRKAMEEHFDRFGCRQNKDYMRFKICQLGKATELSGGKELWEKCFHVWPSTQPVTMLAPPNPDGSLTGVLIMPEQGKETFDRLKNEKDVETLFRDKFPDIFDRQPMPEEWAKKLLNQKIYSSNITTICSDLHGGDRVVLVGDAGHSVWAALGQGCNAALESCRVLAETLAKYKQNLAAALPEYTKERKPDVDAIAKISEEGFGGGKRAGNALFFSKIMTISLLNKLLPFIFKKPAIVNLNSADVSYSQIENLVNLQDKQLLVFAISLVILIMSAIAIVLP